MVDPGTLQIRADQNEPPFTYEKESIKLKATQKPKPTSDLVYVYIIENKKWIVYHETENSPMFMKMAPENPPDQSMKPMSYYYEKFTKPDLEWLELNRYKLV